MDKFKCFVIVFVSLILSPSIGLSSVTGECANCHTMHNSDGGVAVVPNSAGKQPALLNDTCIGCHTASSGNQNTGVKPYVMQAAANYDVNTLAGGDFYWVSNTSDPYADFKGHNVDVLSPQVAGRTPPGGGTLTFDVLTCAGVTGCHGDRSIANEISSIAKTHHDISGTIDGGSPATSYRYLNGVIGFEDPDWELTKSSSDHNQYSGEVRTSDIASSNFTISQFCAQCHGSFHEGALNDGISDGTFGVDPWIRHPTDIDMFGLGGEFTNTVYSVVAPVASIDASADINSVNSTVLQTAGDAVVMCLSCHRAHGSPYYDGLRWDYRSWPGGGTDGCSICHTAKD